MLTGFPVGGFIGAPEDHILDLQIDAWDDGISSRVRCIATSGYSQFYALYCDDNFIGIKYVRDDEYTTFNACGNFEISDSNITLAPLGDYSEIPDGVEPLIAQLDFATDKGKFAKLQWNAIQHQGSFGDGSQLTQWKLTGIRRFLSGRSVSGQNKTQLQCDIQISNSGSTRTVSLKLNGSTIAQGSRVGDGEVTLSEVNSSGIAGTVYITYSANVSSGAFFVCRYAKTYNILVDGVVNKTISDPGKANILSAKVGPLDAGSHTVSLQGVSDTGIVGTIHGGLNIEIPSRPLPPTNLSYVSGDYLNTVIQFNHNNADATYNIYDSGFLNEPVNLHQVSTTVSGTGSTLQAALPACVVSGSGTRRIVVESVSGLSTDGFRKMLRIDYNANGSFDAPKPNDLYVSLNTIQSGVEAVFNYVYDSLEEKATPTHVNLYLVEESDYSNFVWSGSYINPPHNSVQMVSTSFSQKVGTISGLALTDGFYYYAGKAYVGGTGALSNNAAFQGPVWLTSQVIESGTGFSLELSV